MFDMGLGGFPLMQGQKGADVTLQLVIERAQLAHQDRTVGVAVQGRMEVPN